MRAKVRYPRRYHIMVRERSHRARTKGAINTIPYNALHMWLSRILHCGQSWAIVRHMIVFHPAISPPQLCSLFENIWSLLKGQSFDESRKLSPSCKHRNCLRRRKIKDSLNRGLDHCRGVVSSLMDDRSNRSVLSTAKQSWLAPTYRAPM